MGKVTGFLDFPRLAEGYVAPAERVKNYKEFVMHLSDEEAKTQGARCMDCGIPFCNNGCPVNNIIPDWNDLVYKQDWEGALEVLHSTNNFPEFTSRICPAPCESACTLNINSDPVGIKSIEHAIIDKAWENNWVLPQVPKNKTGKKIFIKKFEIFEKKLFAFKHNFKNFDKGDYTFELSKERKIITNKKFSKN